MGEELPRCWLQGKKAWLLGWAGPLPQGVAGSGAGGHFHFGAMPVRAEDIAMPVGSYRAWVWQPEGSGKSLDAGELFQSSWPFSTFTEHQEFMGTLKIQRTGSVWGQERCWGGEMFY